MVLKINNVMMHNLISFLISPSTQLIYVHKVPIGCSCARFQPEWFGQGNGDLTTQHLAMFMVVSILWSLFTSYVLRKYSVVQVWLKDQIHTTS
jgi:hypothetical protein